MKKVQGFSDLYPIIEEQSKSKFQEAKAEVLNELSQLEYRKKKDNISKMIQNSIKNHKTKQEKESFEKIYPQNLDKNERNKLIQDKIKCQNIKVENYKKIKSISKITKANLITINIPPKKHQTAHKNRRNLNEFNNPSQRKNKSHSKNTRRNRKERMESAHDHQISNIPQVVPTATFF